MDYTVARLCTVVTSSHEVPGHFWMLRGQPLCLLQSSCCAGSVAVSSSRCTLATISADQGALCQGEGSTEYSVQKEFSSWAVVDRWAMQEFNAGNAAAAM